MKRIFDLLFSSVGLFIFSPIILFACLGIYYQDKHSPFYIAKRIGKNGKSFNMIKLRSMIINAEKNKVDSTSSNDPRITKIGKIIRKLKLDELSQLFNVFIGDMSVVGPRPHMLSHTEMYANRVDKFMVRHFVKPGITGLAQISGYRGEVETDKDIIGRVRYDIFYIENWSIFLDIKIIIQTIIKAVKGDEKAY